MQSDVVNNPSRAEQLEYRPRGEYFFFSGDPVESEDVALAYGTTFVPMVANVPGVPTPTTLTPEQQQLRERMAFAMSQLTAGQQEVLDRVFYGGCSISALAREQNCTRQAVHKRFVKAKRALATVLEAMYGEYEHVKRGYRITAHELLAEGRVTQDEFEELLELEREGDR